MSGRTFVLIFFFWAVITIITPTLILWSETSKAELDFNGGKSEGIKIRRMMGYPEKHPRRTPRIAPAPAPAPAFATPPEPTSGI